MAVIQTEDTTDSVTIPETSRLKNAELIKASNGSTDVLFWDLPMVPHVTPDPTDRIIDVPNNKRIDTLSFEEYDTPHYWDLIAQANLFSLLPGDMRPGTKIRMASLTRVTTKLRP